ncbi:MAG: M20/M25/M40 family metallo-hydrolase [Planctomycetota bacterium]|nr:M20/M25/M40 family metallo-hydrolase [Planctomycetota bacterium]MDA1140772.1 M20/M25/M40 family metallo-hydrolase [Planctomycetota bacterium]
MPDLLSRVSEKRLTELTFNLVKIPSPTGNCVEAAGYYADVIKDTGLELEVQYDVPENPNVIGRLIGDPSGPTLQMDGHIDAIPVEHCEPYIKDGTIYGRGAADMKCGLASMAEVARVLIEAGVKLPGTLLLTCHGMHEAPAGRSEALDALLKNGVKGDACINVEGPWDCAPIIGKGLCIWTIRITREGEVIHENSATPDVPHPVRALNRILSILEERNKKMAPHDLPFVGPESYFVGKVQTGDYFNRLPNLCEIVGTRRYAPEKTKDDVIGEFAELKETVEKEFGVTVEYDLLPVRDGYRLEEDEPIVRALRSGFKDATGKELPFGGFKSVGDVSQFVRAGVPCIYHGVYGTPHASLEFVPIAEIVRSTKVFLGTVLRYFGSND